MTEERREMPEDEKQAFRLVEWVLGIVGLLIAAAIIWGGNEIIDLKDTVNGVGSRVEIISHDINAHIEEADDFHKKIPDGFFSSPQWGLAEELRSQATYTREMSLLDKKLALLDKRMDAHDREAKIWVDIIKELTRAHSSGAMHK